MTEPVVITDKPRGCGMRKEDGVYFEVGLSPSGYPQEHFWLDPPIPFETARHVGVQFLERNGIVHVVDWIGEEHYPFPTDVLEEGRRMGFSRRMPKSLISTVEFSRLSPYSRLLLVHARGILTNPALVHPFMIDKGLENRCALYFQIQDRSHLDNPEIPCSRDWYATATSTDVVEAGSMPPIYRRNLVSATYTVFPLHPEAPEPEFASAIIAALPIHNVAVVKAADGRHQDTLARIRERNPDLKLREADT